MNAEYNKWYEYREGQMPEDFDNTISEEMQIHAKSELVSAVISHRLLVCKGNGAMEIDYRFYRKSENLWRWYFRSDAVAWMLVKPFKEEEQ